MLGGRVAEVTRILRFLGLEPDPGRLECVRWCDVDMYRCIVQYSTEQYSWTCTGTWCQAQGSTEFGGSFHNISFKHKIKIKWIRKGSLH